MSLYGSAMHMARFGRPLWLIFKNPDERALVKLVGGRSDGMYIVSNQDHVFAALSVRLCVDVNLAVAITLPLSRTAVNLHLRIVNSFDLFTKTSPEPIVAFAAMRHLCRHAPSWTASMEAFNRNLLGAIRKGAKGELFTRLLFMIVHDNFVKSHTVRKRYCERLPHFTVENLLKSLLADSFHGDLEKIDAGILKRRLNYLMFTGTGQLLSQSSFKELCHSLLRRSAALQLAAHQPLYDLFIPFYIGDVDQPYDAAKAGAILAQVRNQKQKTSLESALDT